MYVIKPQTHVTKPGFFVHIIKNGKSAAILHPKRKNNIIKSSDIRSHEIRGQRIEYEGNNRHVF